MCTTSATAFIVIVVTASVAAICPQGEPDNYAHDNGCALTQTPVASSFTGGDMVTVGWPTSMFLGETEVNVNLVSRASAAVEPRNSTNCRHGYYSAAIDGTAVLSQRIPNTGTFDWTAVNALFQEDLEYHLQISGLQNDFSCDPSTGVIAGVFATSPGFTMASMATASWGWPNAATINDRVPLGGAKTIVFHGLYHQRRFAYELKLMASIDNFNAATAATHSWQARMPHGNSQALSAWADAHDHNLTAHPMEVKGIPNWLGFRDELAGWDDMSQPINTAVSTSLQLEWQLPTDSRAYFKQDGNFFVKSRDDGTPVRLSDDDVRLQMQIKLILHNETSFLDDGSDCRRVAGACGSMEFGWFDTNANGVRESTEVATFSSEPFKIWGTLVPTAAPSPAPSSSPPSTAPASSGPTLGPTESPVSAAPSTAPTVAPASSVPTSDPTTGGPTPPAPTDGPSRAGDTPAPSAAPVASDVVTTSSLSTTVDGDLLVVDGAADADANATASTGGGGDWWVGLLVVLLLALLIAVVATLHVRRRSRDTPKEVLYADPEAGRAGFERANPAYGGSGTPLFNTADAVASRPDGALPNELYQVAGRGGCTVNPQYAVPTRPVPVPRLVGTTQGSTGMYTDVAPSPADGLYGEVTPFAGAPQASSSGPYNAQLSDDQLYGVPASSTVRAMDNGLYMPTDATV